MARIAVQQSAAVTNAIALETTEIGEEIAEYFGDVVGDWKNKPTFRVVVTVNDQKIALEVVATGDGADKWLWISRGTGRWGPKKQSYTIRPKGDYPLRFQTGYSARTAAVAKYDQGDGKKYGDWRTTYEVEHPGIESRLFEEEAQKNILPTARRRLNNRIRREVRKVNR